MTVCHASSSKTRPPSIPAQKSLSDLKLAASNTTTPRTIRMSRMLRPTAPARPWTPPWSPSNAEPHAGPLAPSRQALKHWSIPVSTAKKGRQDAAAVRALAIRRSRVYGRPRRSVVRPRGLPREDDPPTSETVIESMSTSGLMRPQLQLLHEICGDGSRCLTENRGTATGGGAGRQRSPLWWPGLITFRDELRARMSRSHRRELPHCTDHKTLVDVGFRFSVFVLDIGPLLRRAGREEPVWP